MQTHFALLATLLALLASGVILVVCQMIYGVPWTLFFIIVPLITVVYMLSLVIGYFIAEPFRLLLAKMRAYRAGVNVEFEQDGRILEADELSLAMDELVKKVRSQRSDLIRESRRQNDFVSDVAHELRTPITAIRGNAEMLKDPDLPDDIRTRFTDTIILESERLSRLINDLLKLQRLERVQTSPDELGRVNLREVSQSVLLALHSLLEERGAQTSVLGEAPDILGSADHLHEALTNLVENASRFIEPGGHITIELCGFEGNSIIQVKDDGMGIGNIDPNLLFSRFYRSDLSRARSTGGTGLGLSIVKSIVDAHDGNITAVNMFEGGANFIIAIPSVEE